LVILVKTESGKVSPPHQRRIKRWERKIIGVGTRTRLPCELARQSRPTALQAMGLWKHEGLEV